jgi:Putative zinc-finger
MTLLTCAAVRRRLEAFYDRELPVGELIAFEHHIKDCADCGSELQELAGIGTALRVGAAPGPADDWAGLASGVVERLRAEDQESLRARAARLFEDMHLIWIGLASTTATFLCGAIALGTLHLGASPERHDSIAGVLAVMAAPPGSDLNPARLDLRYQFPSIPQGGVVQRTLENNVLADSGADDMMLTLAAVVTREGGVADLRELTNDPHRRRVTSILDAISQARLQPAELGGSPVAVNLVWILAQTTVKGKIRS